MILFVESGRLGNQLFQYAALRTAAAPGERLLLVGFDELRSMFDNLDAAFPVSSTSVAGRALARMRPTLDRIALHQSVVGVIAEDVEHGRCELQYAAGLLPRVRYCVTAYFQAESVFDCAVVDRLTFRAPFKQEAERRLRTFGARARKRIFVHARRGDYATFPSLHAPAALPAQWYHGCMARMRDHFPDAMFVVCSDDPAYIRREFGDVADTIVSSGSTYEDFALMCQCDGGILSASSFSWWAAYFSSRAVPGRMFLAPEYWIGYPTRAWFPPGVQASFLSYVTVEQDPRPAPAPVHP